MSQRPFTIWSINDHLHLQYPDLASLPDPLPLMMSGYNNYWKMGWSMTNSSTSKLQRLILKRVKALLRKVMTNLLPISTPMGLFLTPTFSYMKWINFEMLHMFPLPDVQLLTMLVMHGTPLSEYGSNIAINAFPTLFPTGKGGFNEQ
jgi:hypothetical protein